MATHQDTERKTPPATPAPTDNPTKSTDAKPPTGKDPDLYDPVGMAGQKAGIVEEIQQEESAPPQDADTDAPASKK